MQLSSQNLETKSSQTFMLLLHKSLIKLEDNSHRQQNTSSGTNCTHKISNDRKCTNAHTTKSSCCRDVTVQNMDKSGITMTLHDHLVITQLLSYITGRSSGYLNPSLGEEGTGCKDEDEVEYSMEWIIDDFGKGRWWGNVVCDSSDWDGWSSTFCLLPFSKNTYKDVGWCTVVKELGYKVKIGYQGSLKDDRHVGSVEKLDWVCSLLSTVLLVLHRKIYTPSLEVDDYDKDQNGSEEIGQVGQVLTVQCLLKCAKLVTTGNEKMEESNNSSFEFSSTSGVECSRTKCLPDDGFANVSSDKEGNTTS
eukprot:1013003_1